jgi:hypothetical protein
MKKLCLVGALGCMLGLSSIAAAEQVAGSKHAGGAEKLRRAEEKARAAVAPLPVERVVCIHRSRRSSLCMVLHQASGPRLCRSAVIVRRGVPRVTVSNYCFEFTGVRP